MSSGLAKRLVHDFKVSSKDDPIQPFVDNEKSSSQDYGDISPGDLKRLMRYLMHRRLGPLLIIINES